ncbi:DUF1080 domain-containing protein [Fulvivirgaceae bacterium BMA10]|uniref:DUF1080 domain-containing protein n=1 Tax=Splendidivirga corallicola TaxID=3051826 RepID=A0ABT8KWW9_9BACT|nr:DUF1080 domain-containing protein [Fulvivirgaceae bacterium BMA10]
MVLQRLNLVNRLAIAMLLLFFISSCNQSSKDIERPRDPWVFRSVLDKQARMVTAALDNELWVAYNTQSANLYKAWKGGVNFNGAVYTTVHGPQPTSKGYAYINDSGEATNWRVINAGNETIPKIHYKGHSLSNSGVSFKYDLEVEPGKVISIEESPEFLKSQGGKPGLSRSFKTSNVPDGYQVALKTTLSSLMQPNDYTTTGTFNVEDTKENEYDFGKLIDVSGTLLLKSNAETELNVHFFPGIVEEKVDVAAIAQASSINHGKELIDGSDCRACHNETKKTIGPAYIEVAKKYSTSEQIVTELAGKVINGGMGNWGEVFMSAHPDLQESDAKAMIRYILSLDADEEANTSDEVINFFLGVEGTALQLDENNDKVDENSDEVLPGLAANLYKAQDFNLDYETFFKNNIPVLSGTAPLVHLTSKELIGPHRDNIYLELRGYITVPESNNYVFRLVSDDGSHLFINGQEIIDNGGFHGDTAKDGEIILKEGQNDIRIVFYQGGGGATLSLQWAKYGTNEFSVVPTDVFTHKKSSLKRVVPFVPEYKLVRSIPGDQKSLTDVHPSFDLAQARPSDFKPRVGGMDFFSDGRMVVCAWDSVGPVYVLDGLTNEDPEQIKVTEIAGGLAEPLGIKVVDDEIYVLQKQELTKLIDHDGDGIIDEYKTLCAGWKVSTNFHEFAFGLVYKDGYFYLTLATAIEPGGASSNPQIPDRGKVIKVSKEDGSFDFIAHGLRTPNGIGIGVDGEIFVADNQGDWLPSSKIVHVQEGAWYGSRSVDFEGTEGLEETQPLVWLPQDEIGNSPSQPIYINVGPYKGQMLHGEVTHGGLKRVFVEKINGQYQGALFRFTQGLEAGVNRVAWSPDGSLYVGGIGSSGNWGHEGGLWYGLQKLTYNNKSTFEMLAVRAKSNGFELEFTEPLKPGVGTREEDYKVSQWYYLPTKFYGGPKMDPESLNIKSVNISDDRKKVFLELDGMKPKHVVHIRIFNPFMSESGQSLWTTESWYTLTNIPENEAGFKTASQAIAHNTLTEQEKADGWQLLFDGKTTNNWRNFRSETIGSAWKVVDGTLMLDNSVKDGWQIKDGGDIITDQEYENFEFTMEWKIQKGGNSGIIYNVVESDDYDFVWQTGPEMQILDNVRHNDGRITTHRAGDLYDMIECKFVTANNAEEWNQIRLISKDGHVEHWQNGYKVVEFDMHTPGWEEMIKNSKFKDMPAFGKARKGHIALQDHGDRVWFRNIKIRAL